MPKIEKDLWIEGGYYIDFDDLDQFRIIGPKNHLFCGLIDIPRHKIKIQSVEAENGSIVVRGSFQAKGVNLYYPAIDDIRTMRELMESSERDHPVSFLEVRREMTNEMVPNYVAEKKINGETRLFFRRVYEDKFYGTTFCFLRDVQVTKINEPYKGFSLQVKKGRGIPFTIKAETNDFAQAEAREIFLPDNMDYAKFGKHNKAVKYFWDRTRFEVRHLIRWNKTSGDRFGTIFPRDWMESADLGVHDLTEEAREYMYKASMKNVNDEGQGWHEDVVGEYKYEHELAGRDIFDRKMIDIEPHYILGLKRLSGKFLEDEEVAGKLKKIANYILREARNNELIIFKEKPRAEQEQIGREFAEKYYAVGNWRDSQWAFKKISETVAPFDVNAVFYPEALRVLKNIQQDLHMRIPDIDKLISKWEQVRELYKFNTESKKYGRLPAYALALYNIRQEKGKLRYDKFKVNHLDESYLYTYCESAPRQLESFCRRLLDPDFFYTKSGPLLIARNNTYGYTTQEYHGLVIWTKQVAFVVLGLSKHYKIAKAEGWDKKITQLLRKTIIQISGDMIDAFCKLNAIPELHYDDNGTPRFFTDQEGVQGKMSKVQLWSAVGARRLIRKYYELLEEDNK